MEVYWEGPDDWGRCEGWHDYIIVTLPKGKKESQEVVLPYKYSQGYIAVIVEPLPTVDILGEGVVINQKQMQRIWGGAYTQDKQQIPADFIFPYYEVAESRYTVLFLGDDLKCTPNPKWVIPN